MTIFVGDNPVIMTGSIVARRDEKIVIGDGRGNTLIFDWNGEGQVRTHGTPSDIVVDLPKGAGAARAAASVLLHIEGKAVQVRYVIEPADDGYCTIAYTLFEDMRELLIESEAPALAHRDAGSGTRIGMGPEG